MDSVQGEENEVQLKVSEKGEQAWRFNIGHVEC